MISFNLHFHLNCSVLRVSLVQVAIGIGFIDQIMLIENETALNRFTRLFTKLKFPIIIHTNVFMLFSMLNGNIL